MAEVPLHGLETVITKRLEFTESEVANNCDSTLKELITNLRQIVEQINEMSDQEFANREQEVKNSSYGLMFDAFKLPTIEPTYLTYFIASEIKVESRRNLVFNSLSDAYIFAPAPTDFVHIKSGQNTRLAAAYGLTKPYVNYDFSDPIAFIASFSKDSSNIGQIDLQSSDRNPNGIIFAIADSAKRSTDDFMFKTSHAFGPNARNTDLNEQVANFNQEFKRQFLSIEGNVRPKDWLAAVHSYLGFVVNQEDLKDLQSLVDYAENLSGSLSQA